jgi:hypothetical protein
MSETVYYDSDNLVGIGNVGIGTTNPSTNLHVYGSTGVSSRVECSGTTGSAGLVLNGGTATGTPNDFFIYQYGKAYGAGGEKPANWVVMRNDAGPITVQSVTGYNNYNGLTVSNIYNNIGIGVSNPLYVLDVRQDLNKDPVPYQAQGYLVSQASNLFCNATSTSTLAGYSGIKIQSGDYGSKALIMLAGGEYQKANVIIQAKDVRYDRNYGLPLLINPDGGSVGIGTTNPGIGARLDVNGGAILASNATTSSHGAFYTAVGEFLSIEAFNSNNTAKNPVCLCAYGGNIGLGLTNPTYACEVAGWFRTTTAMTFSGGAGGNTRFVTVDNNGTVGYLSPPLFNVNMGVNTQVVGANATIVAAFNTKETDTNTWFNTGVGAYRYTPLFGGYYQINWQIVLSSISGTEVFSALYKNGGNYVWGSNTISNSSHYFTSGGSAIVYLNGSTDYIDVRVFSAGAGSSLNAGSTSFPSRFSGVFVRPS